jgi:hypothetical protein
MMITYQTDFDGIYVGTVEADESQLEPGVYLIPARAYEDPPPALADHEAAKRVGGAWQVIPDWRGYVYWLADGTEHVIEEINVTPPAGALAEQPEASLVAMKSWTAQEIEYACASQIVGGFDSMALGAQYRYPSKASDQANLTASVVDALVNQSDAAWRTPFWCADSAGVWAWRPHSAEQIKQVGRDGKAAVLAAQAKNASLQAQIAAAASPAELAEITW